MLPCSSQCDREVVYQADPLLDMHVSPCSTDSDVELLQALDACAAKGEAEAKVKAEAEAKANAEAEA